MAHRDEIDPDLEFRRNMAFLKAAYCLSNSIASQDCDWVSLSLFSGPLEIAWPQSTPQIPVEKIESALPGQ
jgi:hypothetical protein